MSVLWHPFMGNGPRAEPEALWYVDPLSGQLGAARDAPAGRGPNTGFECRSTGMSGSLRPAAVGVFVAVRQAQRAELPVEIVRWMPQRLRSVGDAAVVLGDDGGDVLALERCRASRRDAAEVEMPLLGVSSVMCARSVLSDNAVSGVGLPRGPRAVPSSRAHSRARARPRGRSGTRRP